MAHSPGALVSVVMCAYNTRPYIQKAVFSILDQTYQNLELIISDDGSTDGTREWLQQLKDPRVRLFLQEENLGYVANKNFALQQARGEFITQNDSDDFSDFTRIERQIGVTERYPDVKIIGCGYFQTDEDGEPFRFSKIGESGWVQGERSEYPFWFPSLMVHRSLYEEFGYYSPLFCGMGDDHYWTAVANEKYPIYVLDKLLYSYRSNPDSITNVLNSPRKLIVVPLLHELFRQRRETGTDWLEQKNFAAIEAYEEELLRKRSFMSERKRMWAAMYIDKRKFVQAKALLLESFLLSPFKKENYRTLSYYLRSSLRARLGR